MFINPKSNIMIKTIFFPVLICISILALSFSGKNNNEVEEGIVIVTRNLKSLIVCYGNDKSETFELKGSITDKAIISDNQIVIKQLSKLKSQGYELKTTISSGDGGLLFYSLLLEKK